MQDEFIQILKSKHPEVKIGKYGFNCEQYWIKIKKLNSLRYVNDMFITPDGTVIALEFGNHEPGCEFLFGKTLDLVETKCIHVSSGQFYIGEVKKITQDQINALFDWLNQNDYTDKAKAYTKNSGVVLLKNWLKNININESVNNMSNTIKRSELKKLIKEGMEEYNEMMKKSILEKRYTCEQCSNDTFFLGFGNYSVYYLCTKCGKFGLEETI